MDRIHNNEHAGLPDGGQRLRSNRAPLFFTGTSPDTRRKVAIIPARSGSKRVPGKNIINFKGKPMIAWTIDAARESGLFDRIIVSTDSEEVATIATQYGAEVPFLRDDKADDDSPVSEATLRTVIQLEENGDSFDDVVQLFAVCPLRTAADIVEAWKFYEERQAPQLLSCYRFNWMNPWWAVTLNDKNEPNWVFDHKKKRSQDLPSLYAPTGAIWISSVEALKKSGTYYGPGHIFWEMDWKRAIDIDNYEDIELALAFSTLTNETKTVYTR